jgi:hypothetical protein
MSDQRQIPLLLLDANACNALQRIADLNELEQLAEAGCIDLAYTETTWHEALIGSLRREEKVIDFYFVGLSDDKENRDLRRLWREAISQLLFPRGAKTDGQWRDVDALLTVKMSDGCFVTRDGGSKTQPGGILGHKHELAKLGIRVMDFGQALAYAKNRIS